MKKMWNIMVVDDEEVMRESLAAWLREDGYTVDTAESGKEAIEKARAREYAICFVDLKMPGGYDGIETMMEIRLLRPEASIIIVTAYATVDTAITAMKEGAQEYIVKPCNPEEISLLVSRIIKIKNLQRENSILRKKLSKQYSFCDIISKNPKMGEIFTLVREVSSLRSTVLIQGESGTGKEMIARAIHFSGDRAARPFIGVSCAALTESLLESELFGHEKGSFTGAVGQKKGKFELAEGGTIFLDEIGDISPKLQMNLLRVLQERNFYRVGGTEQISVDVRVIAATNRDLEKAVRDGAFRDDLFYRLNVINIHLPSLRDRKEDIPLLVRAFIEQLGPELGREVSDISEGALKVLLNHQWPGNVRELENAVERAIVTCKTKVLAEEDFTFIGTAHPTEKQEWCVPEDLTLDDLTNRAITATLQRTHGNIKEAAAILGVDRSTLYDRIKKYNLPRN
ncbi:MAG: sigma-54-dependent Fis family transcriptional regulator [Bacteroidetes bacterium]|nr:MAG: sigma-54-dependent Fis family transcriptional regulator [Bacteroidota bacterium]